MAAIHTSIDPGAYGAREGGSFEVEGAAEGWGEPVAVSVTVEPAVITATTAPEGVSTIEGVSPTLPATVGVTWSNGDVSDEAVAWDAVDPASFASVGTFDAIGSIEGWASPVSCTVTVVAKSATSIAEPVAVTTPSGTAPSLLSTISVSWDNGTTTDEAVIWDAISEDALRTQGTLAVPGTFDSEAAQGVQPKATITVGAPVIVGFGEIPDASTTAGVRPDLPATVAVVMSDGTTSSAAVTWEEIPAQAFYSAGTFGVQGTVEGFDEAAGTCKVVNLTTNVAALTVFLTHGTVWVALGLVAGLCNMAGAWIGTSFFMGKGIRIVRPLMLCVLAAFFVKLLWDVLEGA